MARIQKFIAAQTQASLSFANSNVPFWTKYPPNSVKGVTPGATSTVEAVDCQESEQVHYTYYIEKHFLYTRSIGLSITWEMKGLKSILCIMHNLNSWTLP